MTTALIGETINRPQGERVPINIDATVRIQLRNLLYMPYMRGVGYSEFIQRAIARAYEEADEHDDEQRHCDACGYQGPCTTCPHCVKPTTENDPGIEREDRWDESELNTL